jgi:2-dehydro-3-deoxygluconokinase
VSKTGSLRTVHSASDNSWAGIAWSVDEGLVTSTQREHVEVLDRVGAGDAFAGGCVFGLLSSRSLRSSFELGAAHGVLTMTTPGDSSSASASEVEAVAAGARAPTVR